MIIIIMIIQISCHCFLQAHSAICQANAKQSTYFIIAYKNCIKVRLKFSFQLVSTKRLVGPSVKIMDETLLIGNGE